MPRLSSSSVPKYSRHKASGQAVVTIQGRDHYLGPYRSPASKAKYNQLVGEWVAAGRPAMPTPSPDALTIVEVIEAYWKFAERHYVKDGKATSEQDCIRAALRPVRRLYEDSPAVEFGPLALKAVRQAMIDSGLSRKTINEHSGRIRRMFKWAVSEELLPATVYHALTTVAGLQKGRTTAKETKPIPPVEAKAVDATLPHLPAVVADMVRFQRLTGCRPGEVCLIRPRDVDRSGDVWSYKPASHKTEHHGKSRVIFIGPKAQALLLPYLLREADAFCFSPEESERKRKANMRARRKTRVQPSQLDRSKSNPDRTAGDTYTGASYLKAIWRACDRAFPPPGKLEAKELKKWRKANRWSPNQLRHRAATEIRRLYGLEAAQVTLGHAYADVTQIYAERDHTLAANIMREVG
jgi:integrase